MSIDRAWKRLCGHKQATTYRTSYANFAVMQMGTHQWSRCQRVPTRRAASISRPPLSRLWFRHCRGPVIWNVTRKWGCAFHLSLRADKNKSDQHHVRQRQFYNVSRQTDTEWRGKNSLQERVAASSARDRLINASSWHCKCAKNMKQLSERRSERERELGQLSTSRGHIYPHWWVKHCSWWRR